MMYLCSLDLFIEMKRKKAPREFVEESLYILPKQQSKYFFLFLNSMKMPYKETLNFEKKILLKRPIDVNIESMLLSHKYSVRKDSNYNFVGYKNHDDDTAPLLT